MTTNYHTPLAEGDDISHTTFNTLAAAIDGKLTDMDDGTHNFSAVNIDGGSIDNTAIGGATPAAGTFSSITASSTLPGPAWHVTLGGSTQAVSNGVTATVEFDTEVLDSNSNFNAGTYTLTPTVEGWYFCVATVRWSAPWNANKAMTMTIETTSGNEYPVYNETVGGVVEGQTAYDLVYCDGSTDNILVSVTNNDTTSRSVLGDTFLCWFAGWRVV
jgi:hypothetical protein